MNTDLAGLLQRLAKHGVDFVVVGGFAAVVHGSTLVTQDIDVCCDFSPSNLMRLWNAIRDLHPVHRMHPKRPSLLMTVEVCRGLKNLYLDTDMGVLDCLGDVLGLGDFTAVKRRSVSIAGSNGCTFRVLSMDALIQAKKAMNRPKDQEAILQLRAIKSRRSRRGIKRIDGVE